VKLQSLELLNSRLRELAPHKLEKCCPRRIVPPNGYPNPQVFAGQLFSYTTLPEDKPTCNEFRRAATSFLERLTPTYFIGNDLLRACLATEAPEAMTVGDIRFPIESFLLVLSWEVQRELFHGLWAPFIQVHVHGDSVHVIGALYADNQENTPICAYLDIPLAWAIRSVSGMNDLLLDWGAVTDIHVSQLLVRETSEVPITPERDAQFQADAKKIYEEKGVKGLRAAARELNAKADKLDEEIAEIDAKLIGLKYVSRASDGNKAIAEKAVGRVAAIVLKVVLALTARPELVEASTLLRPAKVKNGETVRDALWSPIILGRNYRLEYGPNVNRAHVGAKRMHWRRGHYRNQRHGINFSLLKLIWIEPVLVNAPDE
jgi:hypothetical protein